MNPEQIRLVQETMRRAERIGAHFVATFYAELFALEPALKPMFRNDMIAQGQKLIDMLSRIVTALDEPQTLAPIARELAIRHLDYGVEARHYDLVGKALLRTLKHEIGPDFTPAAREAWTAAYETISRTMREAAYGTPPRAL